MDTVQLKETEGAGCTSSGIVLVVIKSSALSACNAQGVKHVLFEKPLIYYVLVKMNGSISVWGKAQAFAD